MTVIDRGVTTVSFSIANVGLLKHELQNACDSLAKSCPSITKVCRSFCLHFLSCANCKKDEYKRLLVADADIFKTLLPHGI